MLHCLYTVDVKLKQMDVKAWYMHRQTLGNQTKAHKKSKTFINSAQSVLIN